MGGRCRGLRAPGVMAVALTVAAVTSAAAAASGASARQAEPPDGLVSGRVHHVRLRPHLGEVPRARDGMSRRAAAAGRAAIATCDPAQVVALRAVPTTSRSDDRSDPCVVLASRGAAAATRSMLGPATFSGNEIERAYVRRASGKRFDLVLRLSEEATALLEASPPTAPLALDLDGEVVGDATLPPDLVAPSRLSVSLPKLSLGEVGALADLVNEARSEQLVELARTSTMTRSARQLMADAAARVDDKGAFRSDCRTPEVRAALVLGCYDGRIFILRVTRADLAGVMTVTAAHEMLHAAFHGLERAERRRVADQLEAFMGDTGNPRIEDLLVLYEELEPGQRVNELHSLVGTQVRDLPRGLERYYSQYFSRRSRVIDAFDDYQAIFDYLQANYDRLSGELDALKVEIDALEPQVENASSESQRLFDEIGRLRAQGRIDESNRLVDAQNAAASSANALAAQFNGLVDQHNAKVVELNQIAFITNATYNEISPIPIEPSG